MAISRKKEMTELLHEKTPQLFKLYCSDKNFEKTKEKSDDFLVPGSMKFMRFLKEPGVKNYFVTGAVVEKRDGNV